MTKKSNTYIAMYFLLILAAAPMGILSFDSYYYWDWSRHLALSYYDGSPMIAYFIRASTILFGDTLFALSLTGIVVTAVVCRIIFKSARLFMDKEASYIATMLWLFSPLVTTSLLHVTTYDLPLTLFWALTVYYVIKYIKYHQSLDFYLAGISIGLMMLSKYSGVVLVLGLMIFLCISPYRSLFKTKAFYTASLLALVIFSPVILWNYQHEWQSFLYQLNAHQISPGKNPLLNLAATFFTMILPLINFPLSVPVTTLKYKYAKPGVGIDEKTALIVLFCLTISVTFLGFYLLTSATAILRDIWLSPYLVSTALLAGFAYYKGQLRKSTQLLIFGYALVSVSIILLNNKTINSEKSCKWKKYNLIQQFNTDYPNQPKTVLTSNWIEARALFFLKNKPTIYTLDCGEDENQYLFWSREMKRRIFEGKVKTAWFISMKNHDACLKKYFDNCRRLPTQTYLHRELYAYECLNKKQQQAFNSR